MDLSLSDRLLVGTALRDYVQLHTEAIQRKRKSGLDDGGTIERLESQIEEATALAKRFSAGE